MVCSKRHERESSCMAIRKKPTLTRKNDSAPLHRQPRATLKLDQGHRARSVKSISQKGSPIIGFWTAVSLVMGTIVGAGAFLLPSVIARFGAAGLFGWAFSGGGAVFLAMNFARISQRFTAVGGPYHYVRTTLGDWAGFQIATSFVFRGTVTIAALALVCTSYLSSVFPGLAAHGGGKSLVGCALIVTLMVVNLFGLRPVTLILVVSTALKLIPLVFMATVGIWFVNWQHFVPINLSDVSLGTAIMTAASLTFFSLMGMESATVPAGDVKNPQKTIPRATLTGALAVIVLYLLSATAVMGLVHPHDLAASDAPYNLAMAALFGDQFAPYAPGIMACFILVSCLGAMNAHMLTLTKLPQAAARDNLFPELFGRVNRYGTPWLGLLLSSCGACVLIVMTASERMATQFETVIAISCFLGLLIYATSSFTELLMMAERRITMSKAALLTTVLTTTGAFGFCLWAMNGIVQKLGFLCLIVIFGMLPLFAFSKLVLGPQRK